MRARATGTPCGFSRRFGINAAFALAAGPARPGFPGGRGKELQTTTGGAPGAEIFLNTATYFSGNYRHAQAV
jgi:hypothetical protein